jgi:3-phosphoshikimate 1-carboxyvinyltransferase
VSKPNNVVEMYPPLHINPAPALKGTDFNLTIPSAQIKSAIMLAALYAKGETSITEPYTSRDHTERMLKLFGVDLRIKGTTIICQPAMNLVSPKRLTIPADFSSAAFFIVLGLILKNSTIIVKDVNINPTRTGLLRVLQRMGADIIIRNKKDEYEPLADICVASSRLQGTIVEPWEIPLMIDEVPILCVAASFAKGVTEIRGVNELRVKETDRVYSMLKNLSSSGVNIVEDTCGVHGKIVINGDGKYKAGRFRSYSDHRTAMSMIIFAMALAGQSEIDDTACISKSFPNFMTLIKSLHTCG